MLLPHNALAVTMLLLCAASATDNNTTVTSADGLTTVTIDAASGDLASISGPGHEPITLTPGSGSFIGYTSGGIDARVYPNVRIAPCDAADAAQQFSLLPSGRVVTADGAHCLDVWDCGRANGTVVDLFPCSSAATCGDASRTLNELFALDSFTGELWSLLGPPRTLCVDVYGGKGPTVDLWACTGGLNQRWAYNETTMLFESLGKLGWCLAAPTPPCAWLGAAALSGGGGAPVVVARNATCLGGAATVLVTDTYAPAAASITWTSSFAVIAAAGAALPAFTVPLGATLRPAGAGLDFWTTWTRGCVDNGNGGYCIGEGAWREPFTPLPLPAMPAMLFRLGNRDFGPVYEDFGSSIDDSITVPLVSLLRTSDDFGVSLLLSPAEPLLELLLRVDGSRVDFARLLRRLGSAPATAPVVVTAHLRAHAADWRPALALLLDTHPAHVLPHAVNVSDIDGLGGYSWEAPVNRTYADSVGFKTNWELSGTFMPYDGLFAPYQDEWLNLGPINKYLPQYNVTYSRIEGFDASVQAAGLNSLTYFDVGNWGVSIDTRRSWPNVTCGVRPSGAPAPCPTPDGSNAFLQHYLSDALLDDGWSAAHGFFTRAKSDWVGTTLMDPSEPFFEDLLLEQLDRRMGPLVPSAQGIAIDRFDYTAYYSLKRDDGVSWVPRANGGWGPAQSFVNSHVHVYTRLASALRAASPTKLMLGNCGGLCRIDVGGVFDGGFSEGAAVNAVAWLGLRRPTIMWTYSLDTLSDAALDEFFQQHALMRVFPMAPMPGNDHSIQPGSAQVQRAYEDYAPVFKALRGLEWVLDAVRPVANTNGLANVFRAMGTSAEPAAPGELLAVVVLGGSANTTNVTVSGASLFAAVRAVDAFSLVPGAASAWLPLGRLPVSDAAAVSVAVPMQRGCALLKLVPAST